MTKQTQLGRNSQRINGAETLCGHPPERTHTCHQGSTEPIGFAPKWLKRLRKVLVNEKGLLDRVLAMGGRAETVGSDFRNSAPLRVNWCRGQAAQRRAA
jgi:hypothetical protein